MVIPKMDPVEMIDEVRPLLEELKASTGSKGQALAILCDGAIFGEAPGCGVFAVAAFLMWIDMLDSVPDLDVEALFAEWRRRKKT